ncbi:protease [[Clostridium] sordellii]|uniref:Protease n=1 Tax=Paraclostridium sordellii TaxID=1505 RepID=A0A9P1P8B7_PARSO|nr:NfeD family protein [Paeniclostridium sordellii]EPZ58262.1 nfeD-like partner-binding family protein [[Clostridium] sordellii VPI 9048] [Paeniclostridium sordellii VPI 9048]MDU6112972.1 NfeD family protein [Paeniclostridium sordellii]MDU7966777.1 NfeD family protein [Paeniclostridium sordellii]RGX04202.1 NfeD family protein [Paeniclostridium sordellii]TAN68734.1 NfeD family protein [Paeniclostridium sordellii 8483]
MFLTWIIIGIILLIIEAITISFVSIFFAIGCFIAAITSLAVDSIGFQIVVMCIFSGIGVIFGRKILQRYFEVNKEVKASTINALIGKTGVVTKDITQDEIGLVKIEGEIWSAASISSEYIPKNSNVLIENIDGVKLIVKKI